MSNQVVVAYDFSDYAEIALDTGVELACRDPNHVLHILTVLDDSQDYLTADEVRHQLLRRFRSRVNARCAEGDIELYVHTRIGDPVAEIVGLAEDVGADLVIVGSHGRSRFGRLLLGSVSQGVLHGARCPVLVARTKTYANVSHDRVVEAPPPRLRNNPPHRYSYTTGAELLTRPNEWPL
jgi:nucleotide-binding universal stress UspA family protein